MILLVACVFGLGALIGGSVVVAFSDLGTHAHGGVVYTPPSTIDNTGRTDVSDALNTWIATGTTDGTAADPAVIDLDGTYRVEYGLTIGNYAHDVAHPGLPGYSRNHIVLDLTHATLLQTDPTPYRYGTGKVLDPRKRWGVPLLKLVKSTGVEILGGHLTSTNELGKYAAYREPWAGVTIANGVRDVTMLGMNIDRVWGDFVYISGSPWPTNILIDGGHFERNGRQGVTFNAVDNLEIRNVNFYNVQRMLFDHEPTRTGGATHIYIHDNTGYPGGMGYMNVRPGATTPLGDIRVENNHLFAGHLHVIVSAGPSTTPRHGFTFINNTTDTDKLYNGGYLARQPLIFVPGNWDDVTISGNHDHGNGRPAAIQVSAAATNVTIGVNDLVGFKVGTTGPPPSR